MLQPQNFSDFNIGQVKVLITLNSNSKNDYATLMPINQSDDPITGNWSFPWEDEIRKSAKAESRSSMRRSKHPKGFGVLVTYLKPEEVMAGTQKVRTYKEWEELLSGDFGKEIGIIW